MKLSKLLERLEYEVVQGSVETEVTTLANDSRKVESGSVLSVSAERFLTGINMFRMWQKKARRRL